MLAVIETHPIQYHAPVYRLLQQRHGVPVTAIYGSDFSVTGYRDADFGVTFAWDTDLLSGYDAVFLSRVADGGARSADAVSARGLAAVLRRLNPAAVLTVGYSPRFHRDAWIAAWRGGYPLLFRGETNDDARPRPWWKQLGRDTALRAAYRGCARLMYVGRRSLEHFERLGISHERLVFSPYCVDASVFDCTEDARERLRPSVRQELGISLDDHVLMFAGKLSRQKGVDLLAAAAAALPADVARTIVLLFVGDGALRGELEAALAASGIRTHFVGFQNQRRLSRYYHAADLLVLPSHSETWGLVVNEALHHGVPVVVSDRVGCAPDLVENGQTGEVFASGSAAALTGSIVAGLRLCDAPGVRDRCRVRVSGYTIDRAAEGMAEAYWSAVRRDRAA